MPLSLSRRSAGIVQAEIRAMSIECDKVGAINLAQGVKEKAMHLLARTGVACVPGEAFYPGSRGENLARFCFAKTDDELEEACLRLEKLGYEELVSRSRVAT